ncbi:hypothetical protein SLA2020_276600 [Shorea laevis]
MDVLTMNQVHRYIIFNSNDFLQLRRTYVDTVRCMNNMSEEELEEKHRAEFCVWYRDYVNQMDNIRLTELGKKLE